MGPLPTCTTTPASEYIESAPRASSVVLLSFSSSGNTTRYISLRILQQQQCNKKAEGVRTACNIVLEGGWCWPKSRLWFSRPCLAPLCLTHHSLSLRLYVLEPLQVQDEAGGRLHITGGMVRCEQHGP